MTLRYKPVMDNFAPDYVVWIGADHALGGVLHPCDHRARKPLMDRCARSRERWRRSEADVAAQLIERLLGDPAFRAEFRRDPASACRKAGLDELADEMSLGAGKAMMTLDTASRSPAWPA